MYLREEVLNDYNVRSDIKWEFFSLGRFTGGRDRQVKILCLSSIMCALLNSLGLNVPYLFSLALGYYSNH